MTPPAPKPTSAASSKFLRNMGWMGASRLVNRFTRLGATIALAQSLSSHDYGLAAIVLTTNEFVRVFTRNGIGARLIQVEESRLEALCDSAFCLNWLIFLGLFAVQCLVAFPIASTYEDSAIIMPIIAMAFNLLILPLGMVNASLIQREGRLNVIAISDTCQVTTENITSMIFALCGFGLWSIVLPRLIVAPIWIIIMLANHSWRPKFRWSTRYWKELSHFGRYVLGVELLNTLRSNLDYLIVGKFLSVEALGVYYFAFNAGIGLSLGLVQSVKAAILPHLCEVRTSVDEFKSRYYKSLKTIAMVFLPIVILQSSLAPIYVPLAFGDKWLPAIPILILVCISAIPRPFADAASQLLLAIDKPHWDMYWNVIFTAVFAGALLIGVHWGSYGVAIAVLLTHMICLPIYIIFVSHNVFKRLTPALIS